mmetsp:Transcript_13345/g.42622  ORF Transcript_13345/g.42622 Transcript_13345/m.42622 type:complete len:201 (+) Transcript_13345:563-1165(+)
MDWLGLPRADRAPHAEGPRPPPVRWTPGGELRPTSKAAGRGGRLRLPPRPRAPGRRAAPPCGRFRRRAGGGATGPHPRRTQGGRGARGCHGQAQGCAGAALRAEAPALHAGPAHGEPDTRGVLRPRLSMCLRACVRLCLCACACLLLGASVLLKPFGPRRAGLSWLPDQPRMRGRHVVFALCTKPGMECGSLARAELGKA